jgi:biopolymer transport protein ExbD
MAEINVTPLVDVMLVLLVIFIITAPLLSYAIKLDLPNDPAPATEPAPATVKISIDAAGTVYWDGESVSDADLVARMTNAAKATTLPEVHVRADKATRYERISFVLSTAQQAGLAKIGFVTEPARSVPAK